MRVLRGLLKRNKNSAAPAEWQVRANGRIELGLRKVSDRLSRRTQYWSRSSWIVALGLFILLFGGCCLFLIIRGFIHLHF